MEYIGALFIAAVVLFCVGFTAVTLKRALVLKYKLRKAAELASQAQEQEKYDLKDLMSKVGK